MEFKDKRDDVDLKNGSICVVTVQNNWNKLGMALAVYHWGRFYDQQILEDDMLPVYEWDITDQVVEYGFTGKIYTPNFDHEPNTQEAD